MNLRKDGTVLTKDCPVGRAARLRKRAAFLAAGLAALVAIVAGAALAGRSVGAEPATGGAVHKVLIWLGLEEPLPSKGAVVRGRMSLTR